MSSHGASDNSASTDAITALLAQLTAQNELMRQQLADEREARKVAEEARAVQLEQEMAERERTRQLQELQLQELRARLDRNSGGSGSDGVREQTPGGTFVQVREAKTADPDKYNGRNPDKLTQFILQCELAFRGRPMTFPTEERKVTWATSFLQDIALRSVQILMKQPDAEELKTWDAFVAYLKASFGDPDARGTARRKLDALVQTGTAADYFVRFRELIAEVGYTDKVAILDKAINGLSEELQDEIARSGRDFDDLNELSSFIVRLDNRLQTRQRTRKTKEKEFTPKSGNYADRSGPSRAPFKPEGSSFPRDNNQRSFPANAPAPPPHRSQTQPPAFVQNRPPTAPVSFPNSIPQRTGISDSQKAFRRQNNLCVRCGKADHLAEACPLERNHPSLVAPTQNSPAPRAPSQVNYAPRDPPKPENPKA